MFCSYIQNDHSDKLNGPIGPILRTLDISRVAVFLHSGGLYSVNTELVDGAGST